MYLYIDSLTSFFNNSFFHPQHHSCFNKNLTTRATLHVTSNQKMQICYSTVKFLVFSDENSELNAESSKNRLSSSDLRLPSSHSL